MTVAWLPFCGNIKCSCMEPDPGGPCEEHKGDSPNPRCIECGWPEHRHFGSLRDAPPIHRALLRAFQQRGLLLKDVSELTGLSTRHLSNLIHGRREITLNVAMLLEQHADVDALRLLAAQLRWQVRVRRRRSRDQSMIEAWAEGANVTTIAERHGLSVNWTGQLLAGLGIDVTERSGNQGHLSVLNDDRVAHQYMVDEWNIRTIAAYWEVSYGKIYRILNSRGDVVFRPRGRPLPENE